MPRDVSIESTAAQTWVDKFRTGSGSDLLSDCKRIFSLSGQDIDKILLAISHQVATAPRSEFVDPRFEGLTALLITGHRPPITDY